MANVLSVLSIVFLIVAGVCLVAAVVLWFRFGIWGIIGDLSGRTARKSIARLRGDNERARQKSSPARAAGAAQGTAASGARAGTGSKKKTQPAAKKSAKGGNQPGSRPRDAGRPEKAPVRRNSGGEETALIGSEEAALLGSEETTPLGSEETALLGSEETTPLGSEETALLDSGEAALLDSGETALLDSGEETTLLAGGEASGMTEERETAGLSGDSASKSGKTEQRLTLIEEILLVHTDKTIE